jgi:BASS family bile acid:Na+ symporter
LSPVISTLLPAGLAFIMFALGLKLSVADFRRVLTYPVAVGLGLIAQTVLLPLTAFGIAALFSLEPQAAVGLMILAACPGGVTAAIITDLSRGDTCLSITLTACTSLLSFITVPIIVGFSLEHFLGEAAAVDFPVGQAIGGLFLITLIPVAAGLVANQAGWLLPAIAKMIGKLATVVFLMIVFLTFYTEWPNRVAQHHRTLLEGWTGHSLTQRRNDGHGRFARCRRPAAGRRQDRVGRGMRHPEQRAGYHGRCQPA